MWLAPSSLIATAKKFSQLVSALGEITLPGPIILFCFLFSGQMSPKHLSKSRYPSFP